MNFLSHNLLTTHRVFQQLILNEIKIKKIQLTKDTITVLTPF